MLTLETLCALDENDRKNGPVIVDMLKMGDDEDRPELINFFNKSKPERLLALSFHYPDIAAFCESETKLQERWKSLLKKYGLPDFEIISWDGKEKASFFSRVRGAFYWNQFSKWEEKYRPDLPAAAVNLLNAACETGLFQALYRRLKINQKILNRQKDYNDKIAEENENRFSQMFGDAGRLSKLYWSVGHLAASIPILDVAASMMKNQGEALLMERIEMAGKLPESENKYPRCLKVVKTALEGFCFAQQLEDHPRSKQIESYYAKDGLVKIIRKYADNWASAKDRLIEKLGDTFKIPTPASFFEKIYTSMAEKTEKIMAQAKEYVSEILTGNESKPSP